MTSQQIRQSFLDFFKSKQHTIVPSSSLMPDAPNLLFTNAGMNQFVPIFLGQKNPDVSKWAGAIPRKDTRAADTQKCIRAGGKHNDLEDVGLDTYHHTFFEMLGNWSFGDYFKKEAIEWAWELVVEGWNFPANRLYATVFCPYLGEPDWENQWRLELEQVIALTMTSPEFIPPNPDASPFEVADQEAAMYWAKKFRAAGLDPKVHIIPGNKKDNFWMMGETGPCGPCSEMHVDLTPEGNTRGALVNQGDARCIEIWNLVFIQFNARVTRTERKEILPGIFEEKPVEWEFDPLPAKHVDTGMGFERVTSIIQGTKGLTDFANAKISNYETDIFRLIFDDLKRLTGKRYGSTLPSGRNERGELVAANEPEAVDLAFRVVADHIRTLSFAIADGIEPGNEERNYTLRRIERRMQRYVRSIGINEATFELAIESLVHGLAVTMGGVFPEIVAKEKHIVEVLLRESRAFNKTLDRGISRFEEMLKRHLVQASEIARAGAGSALVQFQPDVFVGDYAFELYDTYGFPLDLTELMARERGLKVDREGFDKLMAEQKARARAAQKKEVVSLSQIETTTPTKFVGFDALETQAKVVEVVSLKDKTAVILDTSACYAEMGGQVGDTGEILVAAEVTRRTLDELPESASSRRLLRVTNTQKSGNTWLHFVEGETVPASGDEVVLRVDRPRRNAIQRHHTVTHLLHWALHEVVSNEASQKGSFVGPDKLTFDFNSAPLTPAQVADIEKLVNERIVENAGVSWTEAPFADVKSRKDVMQFFGDKYGDTVRVVQIGGQAHKLDGYSMELCGGTHTRATGEIGLFRIVGESAIAAGVRRIEAIAGLEAYRKAADEVTLIKSIAGKVNSPIHELERKIENLLIHQKEMEKQLKSAQQREDDYRAQELLKNFVKEINGIPSIIQKVEVGSADSLQATKDFVFGKGFEGVTVLVALIGDTVGITAGVSPNYVNRVQANKIVQTVAPILGGKGGGKPDNARGGGKDASKLDEALARAKSLLG